jgi:hypothetical protein
VIGRESTETSKHKPRQRSLRSQREKVCPRRDIRLSRHVYREGGGVRLPRRGEGREAGLDPIIDLVAGVVDQRNDTVKEVLEAKGPSPGDFDPGVEVARHPSVAVPGGVKCRARAFAGAPTDR